MSPLPSRSTLFPYTTLFRSKRVRNCARSRSPKSNAFAAVSASTAFGLIFLTSAVFTRTTRDAFEKYSCGDNSRSEEHTSELQSLTNLVCRLLLEKKNNKKKN